MDHYLAYLFPLCLVIASITDAYHMRIPNSISLVLLGTFPFVAYQFGFTFHIFFYHVFAGLILFLLGFLLYLIGQVGAGDVKIISASALWLGFGQPLIDYLLCVSVVGAVLVLVIFAMRRLYANNVAITAFFPSYVFNGKKVPYGVAICFAGLLTYPDAEIMRLAIERMATSGNG